MSEPNAFEPAWDVELPEPPFMARAMRLGVHAGARELGATLYELEPGGANAPYHVHHGNEELLIVLSGTLELRTPDAGTTLAVLGPRDGRMFPAGSEIPFVEAVARAIRAAPEQP